MKIYKTKGSKMSKLADEIRAIGFSDHSLDYRDGALAMLEQAAQLVEKRDAERVERLKAMIEKDNFVYPDDYTYGGNDAISAILDMEDA